MRFLSTIDRMSPASRHVLLVVLTILVNYGTTQELFKFRRTIIASGTGAGMFYKLKMTLGTCAVTKLFMESKVWATVKLNRVLDIYYSSEDPTYLVSKVEIIILINNTDVYGRSQDGIGFSEFSGFIILPTRSGIVLYTVNIYSCSHNSSSSHKRRYSTRPPTTAIFKDQHSSELEDSLDDDSEESL